MRAYRKYALWLKVSEVLERIRRIESKTKYMMDMVSADHIT